MKKNTLSKSSRALPAKMLATLCVLNCVGAVTPPETHPSATPVKMEPEDGTGDDKRQGPQLNLTTLPWSGNCTALNDKSFCGNKDLKKVDKCLGDKGNQRRCNRLCSAHEKKSLSAKCKKACCPPPSPSPPPSSPSPPPPSLPPSLPSPPSPPAAACTTFGDKASLKTALTEYYSDADAAIAKYGPIACWDVSGVTDMSHLFPMGSDFNADISSWDTSRVTDMENMFYYLGSFNQPLSWDTSRVTNMQSMFSNTGAFNQPLSWDTSSVTNMRGMFSSAMAFNQPLSWDTSRVTNMNYMFYGPNSLSAANKLHIRCAWADTKAFAVAGYGSSWAPGSCL